MKFDFFKKKKNGDKKRDGDLFDPTHDALDFDELEESGEFLSGDNFEAPPSAPAYPPPPQSAPPPAPRSALPPPPRAAPLPPPPPRPSAPPSQPPPPVYDDLTVVNLPPSIPAPGAPRPPAVPPGPVAPAAPQHPAPPAPPGAPAPPVPPASSVPPSGGQQPRTPFVGDDDVTQILSTPVGEESVVAWLVVTNGSCRGRDFRLPGGMARIGIDPQCDICLDFDTFVSGRHAEISFRDGQYQLRDLDSTNGSFVNEARISEAVLRDNDHLRLGQTTFIFKSLNL